MARETSGRDDSGREDTGRTVRDETPVFDQTTEDRNRAVAQKHSLLSRLYTGTGAFEIVGKRKMWYLVSAVIIAICLISIAVRGFTLGIDFEGGTQISFKSTSQTSVSAVEDTFSEAMGDDPQTVQTAGSGSSKTVQIRTETLNQAETEKITAALAQRFGPELTPNDINSSDVSSTWGGEITEKALLALAVFLVIVLIYIAVRFDKEMSVAAMASLIFDIVCTAGVYSLVGFEVTPATVIGLLTILGFSLYDTVVVFDKVEENVRAVLHTTRRTYGEQANLAINQTLMRSINTTIISVLPIIALMIIAVWLLGVGTLKDLGLIQLVGVVVGAYSSIFFATPLLVTLKERRSDIKKHTAKVLARRSGSDVEPVPAGVGAGSGTRRSAAVDTTKRSTADDVRPSGKRRRSN
ncbi:protein translocase subunit SecF [Williamsia phyllosphaerae]|uniref:Protein-export membrane protein SecF n=1 Tax=Williamsia phyllosphaerae TaxID=885042 RepID=A0ABQ1V848_9NOCA|nr:protein translocase subunit SecF [Williamsia phyllosphaerae]GGF41270.1 protein translocase subunit SecF [Williamsia phyllosphaerae]